MAFVRSASNSERLVHWNKNPRSRIVWRKGDCKLASAASSRASSSIMDVSVSVDASTVENRRKQLLLWLLLQFAVRGGTAVDVLVTDAVVITAARLRVAVSVEREKADAVVAIMAEVR